MMVFAGSDGRWKYEDGNEDGFEVRLFNRLVPGAKFGKLLEKCLCEVRVTMGRDIESRVGEQKHLEVDIEYFKRFPVACTSLGLETSMV